MALTPDWHTPQKTQTQAELHLLWDALRHELAELACIYGEWEIGAPPDAATLSELQLLARLVGANGARMRRVLAAGGGPRKEGTS